MIRILVVDDQNIVREGIQAILRPKPKLKVIGTARNGNSAIKKVQALKPDVVLMDIEMPDMSGIVATQKIRQQFPEIKVLVLSSHEKPKYVLQALQAGAGGYLLKSTLTTDLEQAIWSVYQGQLKVDSQLLKTVLNKTGSEQSLKSVEQNETELIKKRKPIASFNLQSNHSVANSSSLSLPSSKTESDDHNDKDRTKLSSEIGNLNSGEPNYSPEKVEPSHNRQNNRYEEQQKFNLLSQVKNSWLVPWLLLGLLVTGATIIYGLNFANRKTTTIAREETREPIFEAVTAVGRIEPEGEVISLSPPPNRGSSKIQKIMVEEGELVSKGQVIALLDNHKLKQVAVEAAQQDVEVAQTNLKIVKTGAKTGDIEAQKAVVNRLKAELAGKVKTHEATIARLEAQLNRETESRLATLRFWQAELKNARANFQSYQTLAQDGAISRSELDRRRLTLETAQEKVKEAQANYNRTQDTLQEEIKEAQATSAETQKTLAQQIQEAQTSLASIAEVRPLDVQKATAELNRAIANLKQARQDLELTTVKAPIDTRVLKINAYPGEMVAQNEGVVELGQTDRMVVIAEVNESDINRVNLGQHAVVISEGGAFTDEIRGQVTNIRSQIGKKDVLDTDPAADVDTRIVEVKIMLDSISSKKVAQFTNSKVIVKIK